MTYPKLTKIQQPYIIQMTNKVIFGIILFLILLILSTTIIYQYIFNNYLTPKATFECPIDRKYNLEDEHKKQRLTEKIVKKYKTDWQYTRNIVELAFIYTENVDFLNPEDVLAIASVESGFNQFAKSRVGAEGLMQVLPTSAYTDYNRYHPTINIANGVKVLKDYYRMTGNINKAFEMYNVGPGNMRKGIRNPEYVMKVNKNLEWLKSS